MRIPLGFCTLDPLNLSVRVGEMNMVASRLFALLATQQGNGAEQTPTRLPKKCEIPGGGVTGFPPNVVKMNLIGNCIRKGYSQSEA